MVFTVATMLIIPSLYSFSKSSAPQSTPLIVTSLQTSHMPESSPSQPLWLTILFTCFSLDMYMVLFLTSCEPLIKYYIVPIVHFDQDTPLTL